MEFDEAFEIIIDDEHEGSAYVNHSNDPGGETKFGISKKAYPSINISALTKDVAKRTYKRDYWDKLRCDELPDKLRFNVFDFGVNAGVVTSAKILQMVVNADIDGVIGSRTIKKIEEQIAFIDHIKEEFIGYRIKRYTSLPTFNVFGKGWMNRIAINMMNGY